MRPFRMVFAAASIGVAVALVAAGCSSSASTSSSPSASSPSTSSSPSSTAFSPEVQAQLQKVLDDVRVKFKAPGIQVGIWTDNGAWIGTSGVAKLDTTQAITPADHTRIGSITKTMTATVILQLVQEGKVSLTDVIEKYVPGMPNGKVATIQNLLEMQSGIPSYTDGTTVVAEYGADPTMTLTPQQLVDSVKKKPAMFAPGKDMFYSNTNYILLGMVIQKVTGKSISDNFQTRLLSPLGMSQTSVPGASTALPEPYLSGITTQADPVGKLKNATNWSPSIAFTAGEVISTLDDLHKWGVALGTGEGILRPETQQVRVDSVKNSVGMNTPNYSYGMGIVNLNGWLGHTGEIPGYNTILNYKPDKRMTIVVMVNSDLTIDAKPRPLAPAVVTFEDLAKIVAPSESPSPSGSVSSSAASPAASAS